MYFKVFKPKSCGKRSTDRRRRFVQRFLKVGERYYSAEITTLVTDQGRLFYDMTKFKDLTGRTSGQTLNSAAGSNGEVSGRSETFSGFSIGATGQNVNRDFLKETEGRLRLPTVEETKEQLSITEQEVDGRLRLQALEVKFTDKKWTSCIRRRRRTTES